MDPITQGALGAAATLSWRRPPKKGTMYFVAGWLGGMAPDLDVFIRSKEDPLLFLEFHRHFTHSLVFIPIGGVLVGTLLWGLFFRKKGWACFEVIKASTIGLATHGLLDACTTYGTQLFWPFSSARIAWNSISIVDPAFTFPLLMGLLLTMWLGRQIWVRAALAVSLSYIAFGFFMRDQAIRAGTELAKSRGHKPLRLEAKPTLLNLLLWRLVYEQDGVFYVDAIRLNPVNGSKTVFEGSSMPKLNAPPSDWPAGSTIARDFERFRWFSNDYLAPHPTVPGMIGDVRYAMIPNEIEPLWGIRADTSKPEKNVDYIVERALDPEKRLKFWKMLF